VALGQFRLSRHAQIEPLREPEFIAWNSYFPAPTVMGQDGVDFLRKIEDVDLALPAYAETRSALLKKRLIFEGPTDPYEAQYFDGAYQQLERTEANAERLHSGEGNYGNLIFTNVACNLGCSYCIAAEGDVLRPKLKWAPGIADIKRAMARRVLDQYLARRRKMGADFALLGFNGGEITLQWPLIKSLLTFAREQYPELKLSCEMNSNLAGMTPQLASELAEFEISVETSIDGHREHHDVTRVYHKGGGSFDNVLNGIALYNAVSKKQIDGFQGTLDRFDVFSPPELFKMKERGFIIARLAPSLLKMSEEEGVKRAHTFADLFEQGQKEELIVTDTYYEMAEHVARRSHDGFKFYCTGLGGLPQLILTYNIDSAEMSQLCTFVSPSAKRFEELGGDIFSPVLWQSTRAYIVARLEQLHSFCAGCDVAGVCRGGCIMQGLDLQNKPNPAGCGFQRTMWRRYVQYAGHAGEGEQDRGEGGRALPVINSGSNIYT